MGYGGSQSPITMKLNLLASRRLVNVQLRERLLERLLAATPVEIVSQPIDKTVIANKPHEVKHVRDWPEHQLDLLRAVVLSAIRQNRPTFYDWEFDPDTSITIRDNGEGVFVTFKSPPDR